MQLTPPSQYPFYYVLAVCFPVTCQHLSQGHSVVVAIPCCWKPHKYEMGKHYIQSNF